MATPTWGATLTRIRAILDLIPQIKTVFPSVPRVISVPQLPAVVVYPSKLSRQRNAADSINERRTVEIWLYISKATLGIEGESEETAINYDLESLVADQFDGRRRLQLLDNGLVNQSTLTETGGLEILPYPLNQPKDWYFGYVFTLELERLFGAQQKE